MRIQSPALLTGLLLTVGSLSVAQTPNYPSIGQVVRTDARIDNLIPKDAKIDVLASGFVWSEGPVWVRPRAGQEGNFLLFSDVPQNTIYKWTEKDGITTFLKPSGYTGLGRYSDEPGSNGLTIDPQGYLVAAEHGDRRISRMPLNGQNGKQTLADGYQGKRLSSPNDVVAHSSGSYYFTDPPYGMPNREKDTTRELGTNVYRISPVQADGRRTVSLVVSDLTRPNGIAFSPDEKTLYVAQSDGSNPLIMAYPMQADGMVGKGRVVIGKEQMTKQGLRGGFDGMKVDQAGNIWATGGGGVVVLAPTSGTGPYDFLGHIRVGGATANCAWGDDGSTLYITADMYLCRIKTTAKGF